MPLTRRRFLRTSAGALALTATAALVGCDAETTEGSGRLEARPGGLALGIGVGQHRLRLASGRDGLLVVPAGFQQHVPTPLAVLFHGAGGDAPSLSALFPVAQQTGTVLLLPDSRGVTWDAVTGRFREDVAFLDRALAFTFSRMTVDPARLAVGGFSDGASYALAVGLTNGDLFTHVLAFSPGSAQGDAQGRPQIFITHGTSDPVLPIGATSRQIVPALQQAGYTVNYREFDGGHVIPLDLAGEAFRWFRGGTTTAPPPDA